MTMPTRIAWTDEVWNPVRGCVKVSTGCKNCYAERMAARFSGPGRPYEGLVRDGRWTGHARFVREKLELPLRWRKPRRVFVASMGDVFHDDITDEQIAEIFAVMMLTPRHTYQLLTKRPGRMRAHLTAEPPNDLEEHVTYLAAQMIEHGTPPAPGWEYVSQEHHHMGTGVYLGSESWWGPNSAADVWPLPNVWLGVTAENQTTADERIPLLLETPAAVRFASVEPMLSPIDCSDMFARYREVGDQVLPCPDWVICGDESGPGRRPAQIDWVLSIRDQCVDAGVPFYFKQWHGPTWAPRPGEVFPLGKIECPELDGRQWKEYPR